MFVFYLLVFLIFISLVLFLLLIVSNRKIRALNYDISKIIIAVKRVRYGDINVHVEKLNNDQLQNSINRLIETMNDREMMIKEYQSTLSKKNLSLEAIIKQEKQLRQIKEDIVATLTHDMKVPVIAELNSINFLLDGRFGVLNEKQTEVLSLMKSSNIELKDLIENILESYKMEQDNYKLNISSHNLNKFLTLLIEEMLPICDSKSIKITKEFNISDDFCFDFDDFQIKRLLKNLIQNAIMYSKSGSDISVSAEENGEFTVIKVRNKGDGIPPEELNLIFDKYYSGKSQYRKIGTGLGLYLSKKIAVAHGGNLMANSIKEKYTTFELSLPVKNKE